jgi:hypothetical protein
LPILLVLMAIVITHHMTSYALAAFLWAVTVLYRILRKQEGLSGTALIALVATVIWLVYVASLTIGYLSPVLSGAVKSIMQLIAREETGRELFRSSSGELAPLWERLTGIGSVLLILLGMPFGLLLIWWRHRSNPFALVLAGAALAYFATLVMRLTGAGWETANRASEFLFVGISFVLALGIVEFWMPHRAGWLGRVVFMGYVAVIFLGGIIAGWGPNLRLAHPYLVAVGAGVIEPQGVSAAKWTRSFLGSDNRLATDESNARLMLAYGEQYPYTGRKYGIQDMFFSTQVGQSEQYILQVTGIRYVVVDRRRISWNNMLGYFFDRTGDAMIPSKDLIDPDAYRKFDGQKNVSRVFDSGNIVIYDVGVLSGVSPIR